MGAVQSKGWFKFAFSSLFMPKSKKRDKSIRYILASLSCPERDLNLGQSRLDVFRDYKASALTTVNVTPNFHGLRIIQKQINYCCNKLLFDTIIEDLLDTVSIDSYTWHD